MNKKKNNYILLLLMLLFSSYSFSQVINLYAQKFDNTIDTLEFGFVENASNNVDTILGEADITTSNWAENDIRILQKDSVNHECLYESERKINPLYFYYSFESKKNYRCSNNVDNNDLFFEFKVKGSKWKGFTLISKTHDDLDEIIDGFIVSYGGCETEVIFSEFPEDDHIELATINIFPYELKTGNEYYVTNIVIKLKARYLTNIETNDKNKQEVCIFPNPVKDRLFLQGICKDSEVIIVNEFGQIITRTNVNSNDYIDVSNLQSGFYFFSISDSNISGKFLKVD